MARAANSADLPSDWGATTLLFEALTAPKRTVDVPQSQNDDQPHRQPILEPAERFNKCLHVPMLVDQPGVGTFGEGK